MEQNQTTKSRVEDFVHIAQGSAGVLEEGCRQIGFYTDKIATCRPYVFVCQNATIMLHDTSQIQLDAIADLIREYGKIKALHFVEGIDNQEALHKKRLLVLAQNLQFKRAVLRSVAAYVKNFNVAFTQNTGLRITDVSKDQLIRDPNHELREGVNMLNDWFTPAKSESAPLDVQYVEGSFTAAPMPRKGIREMLKDVLQDGMEKPLHGFIGMGALYGFIPAEQLPVEFVRFVETHNLENVARAPIREPGWYGDAAACKQVMENFKRLPIFD